jgi:hypothetical protein
MAVSVYPPGTTVAETNVTSRTINASVTGLPATGAIVLTYVCPRAMTIPTALAGSAAKANVAATGSTTFSLKKNGAAAFGTMIFAPSGTVAALAAATATVFAAGDILTITAPTQDGTLADIGFTVMFA